MIELPWQIIACAVAWLCITQLMFFMRHTDCEERMRVARNEERRLTLNAYRDTYRRAWRQAMRDCRTNHDEEIRRVYREMNDEQIKEHTNARANR